MNKKELKVLRLHGDGHDIRNIAKRIGYTGGAVTKGIEYVRKILTDNGIRT